jgi:hypothetical protein
MSTNVEDWVGGGEYSFLMHQIENKISENLPVGATGSSSSTMETPNKSTDIGLDELLMSNDPTSAKKRKFGTIDTLSSAAKLRSLAELDELTIQNEQLQEQIDRIKSESKITREEMVRQIKFLDEKCTSLKKESQDRLDKYYEEKKKWQTKHRELQQQLEQQKPLNTSLTTAASVSSSAPSTGRAQQDLILQKLSGLEQELEAKVREAQVNMRGKLDAESRLYAAEQEIKQLRSTLEAGSMSEEAAKEARILRKQYGDLESAAKRTAREHDSMKHKLKNQALLDEELASVKSKLRIAEETMAAHKHVHQQHQALLEEKLLWDQLFREVWEECRRAEGAAATTAAADGAGGGVTAGASSFSADAQALSTLSSSGSSSSSSSVSPTQVLHLLSDYQRKCALLLQGQGQLQHSLVELRKQLRMYQAQAQESETARDQTQQQLDKTEHQLRAAQQAGRMYDKEVASLRSLLDTFDMEFRIGKPDAERVFALKDQLVAELRGQLDACRAEGQELAAQVAGLERQAAADAARVEELQAALSEKERECAALEGEVRGREEQLGALEEASVLESSHREEEGREAVEAMQRAQEQLQRMAHDLDYLQYFTGMDYFPDRTRVCCYWFIILSFC